MKFSQSVKKTRGDIVGGTAEPEHSCRETKARAMIDGHE